MDVVEGAGVSWHCVRWRPTDVPSWCQSEASVTVLAPHLTDKVVSGERWEYGGDCVRVRALAGSDHKASLVSAHGGSLCDCRSRCVLASDPGPLLSHSQPARTALAVWRPEEPLPPLRRRPGSSLSLTWRCVGLLRVRRALGGRPHWKIDYWAPD